MDKFGVNTEGFEHVRDLLRRLPQVIQRKALKRGIREGAKVIADEARRRAPVDSGALRRSIKVRAATKLKKKTAVGMRVIAGDDDYKGDVFYAAFIEYGYMKQETYRIDGWMFSYKRGEGRSTWMPPQPFMRPALEAKAKNAVIICAWAIRAQVEALASAKLAGSPILNPE